MSIYSHIAFIVGKIKDGAKSKTFKGAGIAFITRILGAGASFGFQILLARLLSLEDYGSYIYIMAWVGMIAGFSNLGFSASVIRFIPEYINKKQFSKLKGVLKTGLGITFLSSIFFALLGLCIVLLLPNTTINQDGIFSTYGYGFLLIPVFALLQLNSSIEKGKKRMFMGFGPSLLFKPILIVIFLLIGWLLNRQLDAETALLYTLIALILIVGYQLFQIKTGLPQQYKKVKPLYKIKEWFKISLPLLMASGFLMILNRTDVIMLGIFSSKEQVGIYNVAFRVAILTSFVLMAVNAIAAPTISELYHQGKQKALQQYARKVAHLIFWPTIVISIGLVLASGFILHLFGSEFVSARPLLIILLIGQLISASVGSVGYYLNMTGHQNDTAKVYGFAALINIILNPIGIYFYGAVGAALVTACCTALWNIWLYLIVKKKVGVKSSIF